MKSAADITMLVACIIGLVMLTPIVIRHTWLLIGDFADWCIERKEWKDYMKKTRIGLAKHVVWDEHMYISLQRDLVEEYKVIF